AGGRAGELQEALAGGDNDVIVAYTQIAIRRARGRDIHPDLPLHAKVGAISVEVELSAGEEDPQSAAGEGGGWTDVTPPLSGDSSKNDSEDRQETNLSSTGSPDSDSPPSQLAA